MTDRWREVYEREYPPLARALLAIGRDPAAAEDAAQETFAKAHKTGLENIEKLSGGLLGVGTRAAFRKAKRGRREARPLQRVGRSSVCGRSRRPPRRSCLRSRSGRGSRVQRRLSQESRRR